jgi:hypothetical protein
MGLRRFQTAVAQKLRNVLWLHNLFLPRKGVNGPGGEFVHFFTKSWLRFINCFISSTCEFRRAARPTTLPLRTQRD